MVVSFVKNICVYQITKLYTLNLQNVICQLYLNNGWRKNPIDLQFSRLPSTPGSLARCLPEELRVESKPLGLLLYVSHAWFLFGLNNAGQGLIQHLPCGVYFPPEQCHTLCQLTTCNPFKKAPFMSCQTQ